MREAYPALKKKFARAKVKLRLVSAATREGLDDIVQSLAQRVKDAGTESEEA